MQLAVEVHASFVLRKMEIPVQRDTISTYFTVAENVITYGPDKGVEKPTLMLGESISCS